MGDVRNGVSDALALVPRVGAAVGRMEELLGRASGLLTRVEGIVDRADEAIAAVAETRATADAAIAGVAETRAKADEAIVAVGRTTSSADELLRRTDALVGQAEPLVGAYVQPLTDLAPSVRRLADTLEPHEVEALVTLIDRLPRLVAHLDEDILPVLESLGNVGTDVHDLVDTVQDLRLVVKGFPGSRLFRRRGAEEIAQDEAEEAAQDGGRTPRS
jgi:ABC-type transporter Mla subunit MlaD